MKVRLSKTVIDEAVYEGPGGCYLWDEKIAGFGVRIYPSGTKSFVVTYWSKGRQRFFTIGRFGKITLHQAKADALAILLEGASAWPRWRCCRPPRTRHRDHLVGQSNPHDSVIELFGVVGVRDPDVQIVGLEEPLADQMSISSAGLTRSGRVLDAAELELQEGITS